MPGIGQVFRLQGCIILLHCSPIRKEQLGMSNSKYRYIAAGAALLTLLPTFSFYGSTPASAADFADASFKRVWTRTDKLVADGTVKRSFFWGPAPGESLMEPYAQGVNGMRRVQYFDKSRMEINNPAGDPNNPF